MIISAIQFCPRFARCRADITDNFRRCEGLIDLAGKVGSQLIVFPELCMTGYSFLSRDEAELVAEPQNGATFQLMRGMALDLKSYIAWGYIESAGGRLFNSAAVMDPSGNLILNVHKKNLFSSDFHWATSGEALEEGPPPIVKTELGWMSVVICRDIRNKYPTNIPRVAAEVPMFKDRRVDIVAAPANWGKGGFPASTWMEFTAENKCTLVVANRWGSEVNQGVHGNYEQDFSQGGSAIITRDWQVHIEGLLFSSDCVVSSNISEKI
jgi:predicted amidohydrolase